MREPRPQQPFFHTFPNTAKLKLQFKTGDACAFFYAHLLSVRHDITGSIELQFSSAKVVIEGRHLSALYEALADQTVVMIREADRELEAAGIGTSFPQSISVTPVK